MTLIYKPIGIILGLLGGLVGKRVFAAVWSKIDEEDPPKPTTEDTTWPKLVAATAVQGMIFATVKMLVARGGARAWSYVFGAWPGEKRPDPES